MANGASRRATGNECESIEEAYVQYLLLSCCPRY
jgi:hypothetical protein